MTPAVQATIPGIDEPLPAGERVLWSGAPDARRIAREAMHVRGLAVYFAVLLLLPALAGGPPAERVARVGAAAVWLLPLGLATLLFGRWLAGMVARTTVYAVTDRRVVLRLGVALPVTFNIPLAEIESVDLRAGADGSGDVALSLGGDARIAWLLLWPHARPWRVSRPAPMLRGLPDAAGVADRLGAALRASVVVRESALPARAAS